MLYTSTKPLSSDIFSGKVTVNIATYRPPHLSQGRHYARRPMPGLIFLFSLCLSACGVKPLLPAPTPSSVQEANLTQPLRHEPTQAVATTAANHGATTAPHVFARGQEALQAGQYANAIALFKEATEINTTDATYYLWLGRAYGYQAKHASTGDQFMLARQVRKSLEKAVALNPELIEARLDLLTYYLQAPSLLGGGIEKAKTQAAEITKRDSYQGTLAWQQCQHAEEEAPAFLAVSR